MENRIEIKKKDLQQILFLLISKIEKLNSDSIFIDKRLIRMIVLVILTIRKYNIVKSVGRSKQLIIIKQR
ncbi:hypothetical protein [Chryseobacterium indoltheticum]|uniref:Uncharacterized protein n=1 Tax=Chryseobacterium indoltheticum TaxID=254 RepID=A0A381FQM0_9FLAO|nr:hypothetical protein [Chryseobacterium indoltheticum]SUX48462.1 Uncharacterised protein [Chryseobacterium indoltheticum]